MGRRTLTPAALRALAVAGDRLDAAADDATAEIEAITALMGRIARRRGPDDPALDALADEREVSWWRWWRRSQARRAAREAIRALPAGTTSTREAQGGRFFPPPRWEAEPLPPAETRRAA